MTKVTMADMDPRGAVLSTPSPSVTLSVQCPLMGRRCFQSQFTQEGSDFGSQCLGRLDVSQPLGCLSGAARREGKPRPTTAVTPTSGKEMCWGTAACPPPQGS